MRLEVHQLKEEDVYKDLVRISEAHRKDSGGNRTKENAIHRLSVEDRSTLVSIRGMQGETKAWIRMDDKRVEVERRIDLFEDFLLGRHTAWEL